MNKKLQLLLGVLFILPGLIFAQDVITLSTTDSIGYVLKNYTGTATDVTVVIPGGYTSPEFVANKNVDLTAIPTTITKLTIRGDKSLPVLNLKQFVLPNRALDSFTTRNLSISGVDEATSTNPYSIGNYMFNCSNAAINVTNVLIDGCKVANYRGVIRLQASGVTMSNISINNSVVRNIGYSSSSYNLLNTAQGSVVNTISLTNSTFYSINSSFLNVSAIYASITAVTIDKCTFDNVLINGTSKYLLDLTTSNTTTPVSITNSIFARVGASNKGVRGGVITSTNNYATTDWVLSGNTFTTTAYSSAYNVLFTNPTTYDVTNQSTTAGDYTIRDITFPTGVGATNGGLLSKVTSPKVNTDYSFNGKELRTTENTKIEVYSTTGSLLKSAMSVTIMSVADLNKGIYVVHVGNSFGKIAIR